MSHKYASDLPWELYQIILNIYCHAREYTWHNGPKPCAIPCHISDAILAEIEEFIRIREETVKQSLAVVECCDCEWTGNDSDVVASTGACPKCGGVVKTLQVGEEGE